MEKKEKKITPKKNTKTSKKNGFTLIELLAVIIILGILMIIAIPSVTRYINDSRKSAYVDTAKNVIGSARNLVNSGELGLYDKDATYYIPISCIKTENATKSPYGEFKKDSSYVVVTYNGQGYDYYWTSLDDAGQGIRLVSLSKLSENKIESDMTSINTGISISGKNKIVLFSDSCNGSKQETTPTNYLSGDGSVSEKFNFLKARFSNGHSLDNEQDFWQHKDSICMISFQTSLEEPSNYLYSYDVSEDHNGSIMAYVSNLSGGCKKVTIEADGYVYANPDSSYLFGNMYALSYIEGIDNLKVDYVTNMSHMFAFVGNFEEFDISSWNTSRVTDMSRMFTSWDDFYFMGGKDLDLSYLDTSNVTNMYQMFYGLYYVTSINLNGFDTSKVQNMEGMFRSTSHVTTIDIRSFDTSNVTDMTEMFWGDNYLSKIIVGNKWNTNKVTSSTEMFKWSTNLPNYNDNIVDKTNANTSSTGYLSTQ